MIMTLLPDIKACQTQTPSLLQYQEPHAASTIGEWTLSDASAATQHPVLGLQTNLKGLLGRL